MKLLYKALVVAILSVVGILILNAVGQIKDSGPIESITGLIDDCCCDVETVEAANDRYLVEILEKISSHHFFKIFKVNYKRECPFWMEQYLCSAEGGSCSVSECDDAEVPLPWKTEPAHSPSVATTSHPSKPDYWMEKNEGLWIAYNDNDPDMSFIDLELNPERYTGYTGNKASKIWLSIYNENCFEPPLSDLCLEKRVFYRLVSGLHGCITTHICSNYLLDPVSGERTPNVELFRQRLGWFPERIRNIYFTYLFLLRALQQSGDYLMDYTFNAESPECAAEAGRLMTSLITLLRLDSMDKCANGFDEKQMFQSEDRETNELLRTTIRDKFRNISEIMDCVTCETCKVHAKLQVLGIGTALKILLPHVAYDDEGVAYTPSLSLSRNEIVALINTVFKFSKAIESIHEMEKLAQELPPAPKWNPPDAPKKPVTLS